MSASDLDDLGESESEDGEPPAKRTRIKTERESPDMSSFLAELQPARDVGVVFKFVSQQLEMACSFPVAEFSTSTDLFTKARKSFRVFNRDIEVSILPCRLASQQEQC